MPASKTQPLEKRIEKLERELAAYKRALSKGDPGANAAPRQLAELRAFVKLFFRAVDRYGLRFHYLDMAEAAKALRAAANIPDPDPTPTERTPT